MGMYAGVFFRVRLKPDSIRLIRDLYEFHGRLFERWANNLNSQPVTAWQCASAMNYDPEKFALSQIAHVGDADSIPFGDNVPVICKRSLWDYQSGIESSKKGTWWTVACGTRSLPLASDFLQELLPEISEEVKYALLWWEEWSGPHKFEWDEEQSRLIDLGETLYRPEGPYI